MIERIEKLILSNWNEDREIAVQLLKNCSHEEILVILPDLYPGTPWNHIKEQLYKKLDFRQEDAYYYELDKGYLAYNGYVWYSSKERNSCPSDAKYKLIEDD